MEQPLDTDIIGRGRALSTSVGLAGQLPLYDRETRALSIATAPAGFMVRGAATIEVVAGASTRDHPVLG